MDKVWIVIKEVDNGDTSIEEVFDTQQAAKSRAQFANDYYADTDWSFFVNEFQVTHSKGLN